MKKITRLWTLTLLAILFAGAAQAQNWNDGIKGGGANLQVSNNVAEQNDGSKIIVGGYDLGNALFNTVPAATSLLWIASGSGASSNENAFIVKYSSSNVAQWATHISTIFKTEIADVAVDASGNVYVCGAFSGEGGSCDFYHATQPNVLATSLSLPGGPGTGNRGFIAKYSGTGMLQWCRIGLTANYGECVSEIAVSEDGTQLVVTGRTVTPVDIPVGAGADTSKIRSGSYVLWINPASSANIRAYNYSNDAAGYKAAYNNGLCIDHNKNVIVSSKMYGTAYTAKGKVTSILVNSSNGENTLYAKYNSTGTLLWAKATKISVGSPLQSMPSSLVVDADNNIYIGGWMQSHTSAYNLQFPSGSSSFLDIPVPASMTPANNAYVVKLSAANGYATRKSYARNTASGTEVVSLGKGKCNILYACINTTGTNPSYTDNINVTHTATTTQPSLFVYKLNTEVELQSLSPWVINNRNQSGYIASNGGLTLQCATSANTTISLQTSGTPISLTPSNSDMILASFAENSPLPGVTLNAATPRCAYETIPLSASASGGGPYSFTWSIYNNTTGTYVNVGAGSSPTFNLTPAMYNPYIHTVFGTQVVYVRVAVTNCWGTNYDYRYFGVKGDVSLTDQITEVRTCYTSVIASDAVFSVTALNVDTYQWWYSPDGGASWVICTSPDYLTPNQATMTVNDPTAAQNGYLFRCVMTGCSSVVSSPAELRVEPCPMIRSTETDSKGNPVLTSAAISLYPNPASSVVNLLLQSEKALAGQLTAAVYDLSGRELYRQEIKDSHCIIEINSFINGYYLCVIRQGDEIIGRQPFIVKH